MGKQSQKGAVLIVSLVILLVMTAIGLAGMETTQLEEKMAGNMRDRNLAFQAAEAALLEGENFIETQALLPPFDGTQGLHPLGADIDWTDATDLKSYSGNGFSKLAGGSSYYIEEFPGSDNLDPSQADSGEGTYYRVTARAVGQTNSAEVILQTVYKN